MLLDKDLLFSDWVEALLAARGLPSDRDSEIYWKEIRPLEYKSLERLAMSHLSMRKIVVIDAPLRPELNDPAWVRRLEQNCRSLGAILIPAWVEISEQCARQRMQNRYEARDQWKLSHWEEFIRRQSYRAPSEASLIIQNDEPQTPDAAARLVLKALKSAFHTGSR